MNERVEIAAVWMPQDSAHVGPILAELGPLFEAYWLAVRPTSYPGFGFNVEAFVQAWAKRSLILVVVRVDGKAVGFGVLVAGTHYFCSARDVHVLHSYLQDGLEPLGLLRKAQAYVVQLVQALDADHCYIDGRHGPKLIYSKKGAS